MMIKVFGPEDFEKICHLPAHVQASVRAAFLLRKMLKTAVMIAEKEEDLEMIRELRLGAHCVAVDQAVETFDRGASEYMKTRLVLGDQQVLFFMPRAFIPVEQWLGEAGD